MKLGIVFCSALVLGGCSSDNSGGNGAMGGDAANDTATPAVDGNSTEDTGSHPDAGSDSAMQTGDAGSDAADAVADGSCPSTWMQVTGVPTAIALPDGGTLLLHAAGSGTQNYACVMTVVDGGSEAGAAYAWTLTGPTAELRDCNAQLIGHHFASEAGASAPEWQTLDGTYVIGHKQASYTPDGGSGSVAWLLLQATSHGGTGTLSNTAYIQRLNTDGGVAPSVCDPTEAGALSVPYSADYYFFGP
jgi:hypothetical protein